MGDLRGGESSAKKGNSEAVQHQAEMSRFWYNTEALLTAKAKVLGVGSDLEVAEIN